MTPNKTQVYGSSQSADVVVVGEGIAARHCQVLFDVDGYWIEDLLSKSGTFVNGDSVTNRMLREGDLVHLGAAALVFSKPMSSSRCVYPMFLPCLVRRMSYLMTYLLSSRRDRRAGPGRLDLSRNRYESYLYRSLP